MEAIEMIKGLFDHQLVTNSMYRNEVWAGIDGCTVQVLIRREYVRIRPYYTWQAEQVIRTAEERKDQIKGFKAKLDGTNIILYRQ
ncbi:hypothetical protein [Prevotella pectinovora]|uniref:hypothetical protein n=1 Tax=Prevotella pectinovora TaxID=1602169 RepID=UPI00307B06D3